MRLHRDGSVKESENIYTLEYLSKLYSTIHEESSQYPVRGWAVGVRGGVKTFTPVWTKKELLLLEEYTWPAGTRPYVGDWFRKSDARARWGKPSLSFGPISSFGYREFSESHRLITSTPKWAPNESDGESFSSLPRPAWQPGVRSCAMFMYVLEGD